MGRDSAISRRCERAVLTAYRELRQVGSDDLSAFQACTALYRIHHPEASLNEARRLVAEWIDLRLTRQQGTPANACIPDYSGSLRHYWSLLCRGSSIQVLMKA